MLLLLHNAVYLERENVKQVGKCRSMAAAETDIVLDQVGEHLIGFHGCMLLSFTGHRRSGCNS